MLLTYMRITPERTVLSIVRHADGWAIEIDGDLFASFPDKDIARAAANKRAREMLDDGQPCQVRVSGEQGFFAAP